MSSLYIVYSPLTPPRIKTCADCKYYISISNKCSKFVYLNIVTAEKVLLDAKVMRQETSFCGFGGVHFEYNPKTRINHRDQHDQPPLDLPYENYEPTVVD